MTVEELSRASLTQLDINVTNESLHPLHRAMLEEVCESILASNPHDLPLNVMVNSVQAAFLAANAMFKGMLMGIRTESNTTQASVIINYRGQTFRISPDSGFYNA